MSLDKVLHDKSLELDMTRRWAGEKIFKAGRRERQAGGKW